MRGFLAVAVLLVACGGNEADAESEGSAPPDVGVSGSAGTGATAGFGGSGGVSATGGLGGFGGARAFPTAEGFGTETPGGRGGQVLVVTTLSWDGPGSFSEALYATGPRVIVFRVSGVIEVPEETPSLAEENSYVTVAGQTSPGGITFRGGGKALDSYHAGFHDAVFRHLRFRSDGGYDNISMAEVHHIVFDHCDFSGAEDEAFDITWSSDFTVQWSTIANSSPNGQVYGMLLAYPPTTRISLHHNLSAHHQARCGPHMHWDEGSAPPEGAIVDYRNNVLYNCVAERTLHIRDPQNGTIGFNLVGNYCKAGPNTPTTAGFFDLGAAATVFETDNVYEPGYPIFKEWSNPTLATRELPVPPVSTEPVLIARDRVLAEVGAFPRDAMNTRTIGEVQAGSGALGKVDDPLITTGPPPPADQDLDGMSDAWEAERGLDPNDASDAAADRDDDGYTNVEEYINELAQALVP